MTGETNSPPRVFALNLRRWRREKLVGTEIEINGIIEKKSMLVPQMVLEPKHAEVD